MSGQLKGLFTELGTSSFVLHDVLMVSCCLYVNGTCHYVNGTCPYVNGTCL